jgi:hypothetical protein
MQSEESKISPRLILGVGITLIGILMLLDTLDVFDADRILRFWPALLIVVGARVLQRGLETGRWLGGAMLMVLGTVLLLNKLDVVDVGIGELWPLFIVLAGLGILLRGGQSSKGRGDRPGDEVTGERFSEFAVLSGLSPRVSSSSFKGGEARAFMGGLEIDLRDSDFDGEAVIEVFAMMGGIEIKVPPNWTVNADITPIMGGMEDKTLAAERDPNKKLTLRGLVLMGGIEVQN